MAKRTDHPDQLGFFDEPRPDPTAQLVAGDRWLVVKAHHHSPTSGRIYLPIVEVVVRKFSQFNVTFARINDGPLNQWCLALEDFFAMTRKIA